jgi:hypothetical protein
MAFVNLGVAAADSGWRKKATDAIAPAVGRSRVPLGERQVRAALGLLFLALSVKYVASTLRRFRSG